jgi:hypothetical protein
MNNPELLSGAVVILGFVLLVILLVPPLRRMVFFLLKLFFGFALVWLLGLGLFLLLGWWATSDPTGHAHQRNRSYYQRMKAKGLVKKAVWIPLEKAAELLAYARRTQAGSKTTLTGMRFSPCRLARRPASGNHPAVNRSTAPPCQTGSPRAPLGPGLPRPSPGSPAGNRRCPSGIEFVPARLMPAPDSGPDWRQRRGRFRPRQRPARVRSGFRQLLRQRNHFARPDGLPRVRTQQRRRFGHHGCRSWPAGPSADPPAWPPAAP